MANPKNTLAPSAPQANNPHGRIEMAGRSFGRWTVLEYVGKKRWKCRCSCGTERHVKGADIRSGESTSCGCLRHDNAMAAVVTHGKSATKVYKIWTQMIQRCHNQNSTAFAAYGARGIAVCYEWRESFSQFVADMGPRPSLRHSIDRYPDNDGNYEPGNCRWATPHEQLLNRRNNRRFAVCGESLTMCELCEKYKCNENTVEKRLRLGWPIEDALFRPVRPHRLGVKPWTPSQLGTLAPSQS